MKTIELEIQKFLRNGGTIRDLEKDPYNLTTRQEGNLIVFKYDQISSDFTKEIVREARGLILEWDSWDIVCLPFQKFFNLGETLAFDINLENARVYRKYDGSIIKLYHYNGEWRIATNGTISASFGEVLIPMGDVITFEDAFFDIIGSGDKELGRKIFDSYSKLLREDYTYLFELLHQQNPIVEQHEENKLRLIGIRNNYYGLDLVVEEVDDHLINIPNVYHPEVFSFNDMTFDSIKEKAETLSTETSIFEGFIVAEEELVDLENYQVKHIKGRVKLKTSMYLKYHRLTDIEHSDNVFFEVMKDNETEEFEAYINQAPEYAKTRYYEIKELYLSYLKNVNETISKYEKILEQLKETSNNYKRDFGMLVQENSKEFSSYIFSYVYTDTTPEQILTRKPARKVKKIVLDYHT